MKAQSSIEFLTTYGWAIIIIVVVLAFIVFLLSSLSSAVPNTCIFSSGFSCSDFLIESNATSTSVLLFLSNTAKYPIKSATVSANISTLGTVVAHCSPDYVLPGGDMICLGSSSTVLQNDINLDGVATINASECTSISDPEACTQKYNVNYTATLDTKTTTYSQNICSISLNPTTGLTTSRQYPLSATVTLNGNPISGATVNFSSNSIDLSIAPNYENTVSNGSATTYMSSQLPNSYTVEATFYTCSTTAEYSFTKKTVSQNINYVPVTITNDQSTATQSNFQQMITFNPKSFSNYENSNLSNIEFTSGEPYGLSGSTPLYAWIESGASSTASSATAWINLGSTKLNSQEHYISVNVINSQNTATGTNFQQMVYFNPSSSSYSSYENSDLGNIRFYAGSTELYSWCESGCSSTSSNAIFWINTGSLNIGANSYAIINLTFEPTSTEYDGIFAGEAPQLSATYGLYDNGAKIFPFYDNFKGTTLNTNLWNPIVKSSSASYSINNGITFTLTAASNSIALYSVNKFNPANYIEEQNISSINNPVTDAEYTSDWFTSPPSSTGYFTNNYRFELLNTGTNTQYRMCVDYNSGASGTCGAATGTAYTTNNIFGGVWSSTGIEYIYQNYVNEYSYGDSTLSITPSYFAIELNEYTTGGTMSATVNYARLRSYPPNGVMPTFTLSSLQSRSSTSQEQTTIYMNFLDSNSPITNGYIGYAPQLYCSSGCAQSSYGQYDNGASVFSFYDNFAGTSLDSKWTTDTSTSYSPNVVVSNGVTFTPSNSASGGASLYTTSSFSYVGNTVDFYGYIGAQTTGGYSEQGFGFGPWPNADDTGWVKQGIASYSGTSTFLIGGPDFYSTSQYESTSFSTSYGLGVWTVSTFPSNIVAYYNYQNTASVFQGSLVSSTLTAGIAAQAHNPYPENPSFIQWFRLRQTPPNGVMPSYSIGSVSS